MSYKWIEPYRRRALEPSTDMVRLKYDLLSLPYKPGYGEWFRIEVKEEMGELMWVYPLLQVRGSVGRIKDRWFTALMIMAGYPGTLDIVFLKPLPKCPLHGRKHPHIFDDGRICWRNEWKTNMDLYGDFIYVLASPETKSLLNHPQEHIGCGV